MNQQRSRRFRSAQEAKDKEDARKESVLLWEGQLRLSFSPSRIYDGCCSNGKGSIGGREK
jgi:hypothetical protein